VIYNADTHAIEARNHQPRKAIKTKGHFPNEDGARRAKSTSAIGCPTLRTDCHSALTPSE
jgi:transposase-like protein